MSFKKLGLAITFSPNGRALLQEAKRLQDLFDAELQLIHVGEKTTQTEELLKKLMDSAFLNMNSTKVIWTNGEPSKAIIQKCVDENIDLLIAGALEKENLLNYYIGSVARKILRSIPCSVLILTSPSVNPKPIKNFCVAVDYTPESEVTIKKAYEFAILEKAENFNLIREYQVPGLLMTVQDSGSTQETERIRNQWQDEEVSKLKMLVNELDLNKVKVNPICLYGKQGWEANRYVHEMKSDILVISGPKKELRFIDRVFQNNVEFIFKQLPCSLLVIKQQR